MYTDHMIREETKRNPLWAWAGSSLISTAADFLWRGFQLINHRLPEGEMPQPRWAPGKMPRSRERTAPPLGFPRVTDSLCPRCVPEARARILRGEADAELLAAGRAGEIKAEIVEERGRILMRKVCPKHGPFEDVLSTNPAFTRRIENLFFGRDFEIADDGILHNHGTSSIRYGRGHRAYGRSDQPLQYDVRSLLHGCQSGRLRPRAGLQHRQGNPRSGGFLQAAAPDDILFSGGEPTLSPHFLEAVAYARRIGFYRILAATNGIRFAQSEEFTRQAREAGLHGTYLQFDGTTEREEPAPRSRQPAGCQTSGHREYGAGRHEDNPGHHDCEQGEQ